MIRTFAFLTVALMLGFTPALAQQRAPARAETSSAPSLPKIDLCPLDLLNLNPGCHVQIVDPSTGKPTGQTQPIEQSIWQKIITASLADLDYASSLAASAGTPGSMVRKQCYDALIVVNKVASGASLKNADGSAMVRPDPHLITDAETAAEVLDQLRPGGPLQVACGGFANQVATNALTLINQIVSGGAGLAALGVT